jgi:hypothetical protein
MAWIRRSLLLLIAAPMAGGGSFANGAPDAWMPGLPPAEGRLFASVETRHGEGFAFAVLRMEGEFAIEGDPPFEFVIDQADQKGVSLSFVHRIDGHTRLQFRVYADAGATAFTAKNWNERVADGVRRLAPRYQAQVEQPFRDGRNSGPAFLGAVSIECRLSVRDSETGDSWRVRLLAVPIAESGRVVLASLAAEAGRFAYMDRLFDSFVRSLHEPDPAP